MSTERTARSDPDSTGPVSAEIISGAWSPGLADAGTGPVPVQRWSPGDVDASTTAPQAVRRQGWNNRPPERSTRRSGRKVGRNERVVAFVLNQFPIGHMPVAATHPSRQLPPPSRPPAHSREALVSDAVGLARVRSGEAIAEADAAPAEDEALPDDLIEDYRPHGDLGELEWERKFVTRRGTLWGSREGTPEPVVLTPDTVVDRIGDGFGRIVAALGTRLAQRGVPPDHLVRGYRRYRVIRPLPVWRSVAEPWFAQPGGGIRYRTTHSLHDLVGLGYLIELPPGPAQASTLRLRHLDGAGDGTRKDQG